jgi:hypothetical protein
MKTINAILTILSLSFVANSQTYEWKETYKSVKYPYSISIPKTFKPETAKGPNIDKKFIDDYGASIVVNVTNMRSEEYEITPHDYSEEMLESAYRQGTPNFKIHTSQKIIISSEKVFLIEYTGGASSKLKSMECYIYHANKAYVITCTALIGEFSNYQALFEAAIKSIEFD